MCLTSKVRLDSSGDTLEVVRTLQNHKCSRRVAGAAGNPWRCGPRKMSEDDTNTTMKWEHVRSPSSCSICCPAHNLSTSGLHHRRCSCTAISTQCKCHPYRDRDVPSALLASTEGRVVATAEAASTTGSLGARTSDVSDLTAAVALGSRVVTTAVVEGTVVAAGRAVGVLGALPGLQDIKQHIRKAIKKGTYNVTLLAAFIAGFRFRLRGAIAGDMALLAAVVAGERVR
ncbi:hypothetical protein C8Q70DRAFT_43075 [Cubamyces menziesii]|nr:hypothetical protein C8Q70DRAFT_43075 [Cubamyces menziesii]